MFAPRFQVAVCFLLSLLVLAGCKPQASMTPERFQELVDTPGDNAPMLSFITNGIPHWSNAIVSVTMTYASGEIVPTEFQVKSKTIGGKYIVYAVQLKDSNKEQHSILEADKMAGRFKVYFPKEDTLNSGDVIFDVKAKTYSSKITYSDGYMETTTGSYSDTENDSHTLVYQNGALVMTRDSTNRPISVSL